MSKILVETSARHVHLTAEHVEALFGKGATLTEKKALSQPGQFACNERVTIVGPKKEIPNVSILGPVRAATQVEVSLTDARTLGVTAPVRESGDIKGSAGCGKSETVGTEFAEPTVTPTEIPKFEPKSAAELAQKTAEKLEKFSAVFSNKFVITS